MLVKLKIALSGRLGMHPKDEEVDLADEAMARDLVKRSLAEPVGWELPADPPPPAPEEQGT